MAIKKILQDKQKFIDSMVKEFNAKYSRIQKPIFSQIQKLFANGEFSDEAVIAVFRDFGFEELYVSYIQEFGKLQQFGQDLTKELGLKATLSREARNLLDIAGTQLANTFDKSMRLYSNNLVTSALRSRLGGLTFNEVVASSQLTEIFNAGSRRWITEAFTGISQFDRATNMQLFESAEIEKFVYVGEDDERTRQRCQDTLRDPKQDTGWTLQEIDSSQTPFVDCGGYNCRHEWLPFVGELKKPEVLEVRKNVP